MEVKRAFADGDQVILHCHQTWPDEEYAGIDIFRFDTDGKIVEHWDVLQVIPGPASSRTSALPPPPAGAGSTGIRSGTRACAWMRPWVTFHDSEAPIPGHRMGARRGVGTCAVGEGQVPTGDGRGPLRARAVVSSVNSPAGWRRRKSQSRPRQAFSHVSAGRGHRWV
ncbi:nuclear transport factor 2 family protein [Streptomyces xanthophaeus]|uniref:nuclear transport factor 2 family protein n=1 Tax=Streptomyces xanthophaeus TaxID=67385 RepID=UPI003F4CE4EA